MIRVANWARTIFDATVMSELKAIIFDMDGTLADTEELHRQAFNLAFKECGCPLNWSRREYKQLLSISGGKERIQHCLRRAGMADDGLHQTTNTIHQIKSVLYRQILVESNIKLRPGIRRLIKECRRADLKLAIATSSSAENVNTLLHNTFGTNDEELFATVVTCDLVADKKPSPAVYQYTLANLGINAENCIAIEDTGNGNLAALAAGIKTVITTHPLTIDNNFAGASLVINHLGEPGNPFWVMAGKSFGRNYIDLALLRILHSSPSGVGQYPVGPAKVSLSR